MKWHHTTRRPKRYICFVTETNVNQNPVNYAPLFLSLYLLLFSFEHISLCLCVYMYTASAIYVWSSPNIFSSDSVHWTLSRPILKSVMWHIQKYEHKHTQKKTKQKAIIIGTVVKSFVFTLSHLHLTVAAIFGFTPIKISIHPHNVVFKQLFNARLHPDAWLYIFDVFVLVSKWHKSLPNIETMVDQISKRIKNQKVTKRFANAHLFRRNNC